jgi:hypothetical protein
MINREMWVDDLIEADEDPGLYTGTATTLSGEIDYSPRLVIGFQTSAKPRFRIRARSEEIA